MKQVC